MTATGPGFSFQVFGSKGWVRLEGMTHVAGASSEERRTRLFATGKFQPITANGEFTPGIKSTITAGHTPGHVIYTVESKGQKLVLLGDLMHVAAVQFDDPGVTIAFDTDSKAAAVHRKKAFADAAKGGYWVGSAHLPFPGIGHLRKDGAGYVFVPVNYDASVR